MRIIARALLLYFGAYALDFGTSTCFILLGYGAAETNQFQRSLITSPGIASLLSWGSNQGVWIGIGILGVLALVGLPSLVPKRFLGVVLVLSSLARVYGVATNLGFTLAVSGFPVEPPVLFAFLLLPLAVLFRRELMGAVKSSPANRAGQSEPF